MDAEQSLQTELLRWSEGNAAVMTAVALAAAAGLPLWLLPLSGVLSFSLLSYRCRERWTPAGRFGPANAVTLTRLCGVFALPFLAPSHVALAGAVLLALDGVDGWIARRTGLSGEFGEFFDKESDAFFLLVLCLVLYRLPGGLGAWILAPGLMRYVFVLYVKLARLPVRKEERTANAGWIFVLMISTLLACLAAYPDYLVHTRPLAMSMSVVLAFSFAHSLYRMHLEPRRSVEI